MMFTSSCLLFYCTTFFLKGIAGQNFPCRSDISGQE
jgi:predicted nucleic-acid-binding protein